MSCPLSRFSTTVFISLSEENRVTDKCLEPRLGTESGQKEMVRVFPRELSQQCLSFEKSMGIVMQDDDTITQLIRAFASDNFKMAQ
ncbi:hypothetical protein AVEN_202834-1 [Araneus ventricosus]|uniref:Uncharacterized protein n=1 Tax=Araneus ventricosus TaxID=182803 RepID=A0A4Y2DPB8_ARAVE|nr:hypothetical protein AVEN_202834-1 [Araneus ventricosus]